MAYIGDLGGIYGGIWAPIGFCVGFIIERVFLSKLVSMIYKGQEYTVDKSELYPTDKGILGLDLPVIPEDSSDENEGTE